ncbi:hypothetical protein LFLEISCH_15555 [Listeria fleischmannii subsp. fleischmannii LU2006-1]|nr:hypothetical protein LFLEISCH_15555 [Listeria fleischmannii subsp. fleischmannii LU2006-1]
MNWNVEYEKWLNNGQLDADLRGQLEVLQGDEKTIRR